MFVPAEAGGKGGTKYIATEREPIEVPPGNGHDGWSSLWGGLVCITWCFWAVEKSTLVNKTMLCLFSVSISKLPRWKIRCQQRSLPGRYWQRRRDSQCRLSPTGRSPEQHLPQWNNGMVSQWHPEILCYELPVTESSWIGTDDFFASSKAAARDLQRNVAARRSKMWIFSSDGTAKPVDTGLGQGQTVATERRWRVRLSWANRSSRTFRISRPPIWR